MVKKKSNILIVLIILVIGLFSTYFYLRDKPSDNEIIPENQSTVDDLILEDPVSGLIQADGMTEVVNNCTQCHSTEIIKQNRLTAEQWRNTIRWMQETQNLWELGENEEIIINYLVAYYPPLKKGRRANLSGIEWYKLED